jgi:hypothetical protein
LFSDASKVRVPQQTNKNRLELGKGRDRLKGRTSLLFQPPLLLKKT